MGHVRSLLGALLVSMAVAGSAQAQTPAQSFGELQRVLKPGQSVVVTDTAGRQSKGTVTDVDASSLTVDLSTKTYGPRRTFTFRDNTVTTIARRDSLFNGTLIGVGAGILAFKLFDRQICHGDPECSWNAAIPVGVPIFLPLGAALGALMDRDIGNQVLYQASSTPRTTVTLVPWVAGRRQGLALAMRF